MEASIVQYILDADFGDIRLNRRFGINLSFMLENPELSIPQALGTWSRTKAAYRFLSHPKVTPAKILMPHRKDILKRIAAQPRVLLIQDSTDLDFTTHRSMRGRGYLQAEFLQGLFVHTTLVATDNGIPVGVWDQKIWSRRQEDYGRKQNRKQKKIEDKESYRWIESWRACQKELPQGGQYIMIADREADIFELFADEARPGFHLVVRAAQNRRCEETGHLFDAVSQAPVVCQMDVEVSKSRTHARHKARLEVRSGSVHISRATQKERSIGLHFVEAREAHPASGEQAIHWLLLTTLPVETEEQAQDILRLYSFRWLIERYHYTLKSGCRIEDLQLESADRLKNALALYSIVAIRNMVLRYMAERDGTVSARAYFSDEEYEVLILEARQRNLKRPRGDLQLHLAVRIIAMMGGFLNRKSDGEPGVKSIWVGLRRLQDVAHGIALARQTKRLPRARPLMGKA